MNIQDPALRKRLYIMLLAMTILFTLVFGWYFFKKIMTQKYLRMYGNAPVTVSAVRAQKEKWYDELTVTGSTRAIQGVDVTSEVPGMIRQIFFQAGQSVNKNDILLELNLDDEKARLTALTAAAELAEITYKRDKAQFAAGAISKEILDTDAANLKSALAQVEQQKAILEKKIIRAPFKGKLGISQVNLGQYINPGDKIVTLQALDPLYVDFYIPEQQLSRIQQGMTVSLNFAAYQDQKFTGRITTIDPQVMINTRNIAVEATLANPHGDLLPGMFAHTTIAVGEPHQYITVPQTAISYNPYGNLVYLVATQDAAGQEPAKLVAVQKFVTTGATRGDQVAILTGIEENDQVITSGQLKLKNGSRVVINNTVVPSSNAHPTVVDE